MHGILSDALTVETIVPDDSCFSLITEMYRLATCTISGLLQH
jgi:hypothetical protein